MVGNTKVISNFLSIIFLKFILFSGMLIIIFIRNTVTTYINIPLTEVAANLAIICDARFE